MPKNNKKRGAQRRGQGGGAGAGAVNSHPPTDEENSTGGDNWSTASVLSEGSSYDACFGDSGEVREEQSGEGEENVEQENFEDKLCECIEGLTVKSAPQRKKFLEGLKQGLCKKYCAEFLQKRKQTVADSLLKCLKRGKSDEQSLAARCLGLLAVQLAADLATIYKEVQVTLATLLADNTAPMQTRAQCASTMAFCCFIHNITSDDDVTELSSRMDQLEAVFQTSFPGKGSSESAPNPALTPVSVSCLDAWCLLLSIAPQFFVQQKAQTHISLLGKLLLSSDTELRIAAGEAIALLYDLNRCIDEDFDEEEDHTSVLCELLKELSTESGKHKARVTLRQQRAKFRDILQTVQDGVVGEVSVRMGSKQTLMLEDWATRIQYNACCSALHSGIHAHLQENVMLRDLFDLGAPVPMGFKQEKMSKVHRRHLNSQAEKARTVSRGKNRDKRNVVLGY